MKPRSRRPVWTRPGILAAVAAGGVLGAGARYEVGQAVTSRAGSFPVATFIINTSGSFLLGILLVLILERLRPHEYIRPFAATGFLGAFTTWSTFMVDADDLIKAGHVPMAAGYVVASLAAGLAATFAGMALTRNWPARALRRSQERRA